MKAKSRRKAIFVSARSSAPPPITPTRVPTLRPQSTAVWIRGLEILSLVVALCCLTTYGWAVVRRTAFQSASSIPTSPQRAGAEFAGIPDGTVMEIPRLGVTSRVLEDATDDHLALGAAHVSGTAIPGGIMGNIVIAGHRDHIFRPLRNIRKGDEIRLRSLGHTYSYFVSVTRIVEPENVTPLDPTHNARLTLLTCYPFYFVGHAPRRFVVEAEPR